MSVEIEKDIPPISELPPAARNYGPDMGCRADSGCSQFMTPPAHYMINYHEGEGVVGIADGRAMVIEGIGNLPMRFWSGKDWV